MDKGLYYQTKNLEEVGFSFEEIMELRRLSRCFRRFFERLRNDVYYSEDDGKYYRMCANSKIVTRYPDLKRRYLKKLRAVFANHPNLTYYIQQDPRGSSLYVIKKTDLEYRLDEMDQIYSTLGIPIY